MLVGKWTLLVRVTLDATCISAGRQPGLLEFESTVWIVTVTATHKPFHHFVVKWSGERRLDLAMAIDTELRVVHLQHPDG